MKYIAPIAIIALLICAFQVSVFAEEAPPEVIKYAKETLVKFGYKPEIIKAVKAENEKKKTLDEIKTLDDKWKAEKGVADYMKALLDTDCSKFLRDLRKDTPFLDEMFVMDNQGALVALTEKTSDYWQGDEDKFIKSFNEGKGAIHVSDIEFDESAQIYLTQVSVPVIEVDEKSKKETVIGAITIGIIIDEFE